MYVWLVMIFAMHKIAAKKIIKKVMKTKKGKTPVCKNESCV